MNENLFRIAVFHWNFALDDLVWLNFSTFYNKPAIASILNNDILIYVLFAIMTHD